MNFRNILKKKLEENLEVGEAGKKHSFETDDPRERRVSSMAHSYLKKNHPEEYAVISKTYDTKNLDFTVVRDSVLVKDEVGKTIKVIKISDLKK